MSFAYESTKTDTTINISMTANAADFNTFWSATQILHASLKDSDGQVVATKRVAFYAPASGEVSATVNFDWVEPAEMYSAEVYVFFRLNAAEITYDDSRKTLSITTDDSVERIATNTQWQDLVRRVKAKQGLLTAGSNVTISASNEISATDTTYTAGDNVSISSGNVISATNTTYSAGNGLGLSGTEFSVDSAVVALRTDLPTKTSDLINDGSDGVSTYVESDELATVATSGSYNDLANRPTIPAAQVNSDWSATSGVAEILNKPAIPTVNDATLTITQNGTNVGTFTANASSDATIALTDTTYSAFSGTDGTTAGSPGLVPAPATTDTDKYLKADGSWANTPAANDATLTVQKNGVTVGAFSANAAVDEIINITIPTTAADVSALPASTKYGAVFEASINTTTYVMTMALKDQDGNTLGTAQTIDLPLESVVVSGSYDSTNKKIVLTLQNGSTIDIPVADLVSGLQAEINSQNKLSADLVDDTSTTNKFATAAQLSKLDGLQNITAIGSNLTLTSGTLSATDTTYSVFTGADGTNAGAAGLVPAPAAADNDKFLKGDGTWGTVQSGGGSGIPELTSADYNYPSGSPDGVALWTKTEGVYVVKAGTKAYVTQNDIISSSRAEDTVVYISQKLDSVTRMVLYHGYSSAHLTDQLWMALVGATGISSTAQPLIHWGDVVNSIGNSYSSLMSQYAVTRMVFADGGGTVVRIGDGTVASGGNFPVAIGKLASATANDSVAVGYYSKSSGQAGVAIGRLAEAKGARSVALGQGARATQIGQFDIGTSADGTGLGYNSSNYRLLTGLYDGQSNHDAATVAQGNKLMAAAPTTTDAGVLGQLWTDTTNMHTYQLTAVDTTDPSSPVYTWTQRW